MSQTSPDAPLSPGRDFEWRARNIGYLLTAATDRCVRDKLRVVHKSGFDEVSEAQLALFHNLGTGGDRLTTVAARAGMTKQSMIELVDKSEALALVERLPEAGDRRAKIIGFTPCGLLLLSAIHRGVDYAERRMAQVVGTDFLEVLRSQLACYGLGREAANCALVGDDDLSWRTNNIGRILSLAARRFVRDVLTDVHGRGNRDVTEVMLPLLRNLALEGSRLTEIASRARVTKQSMREMVDRVEMLGLIERGPDPTDRRAKCIMFTARGLDLLDEMRRGVTYAESRFRNTTGPDFTDELRSRLGAYGRGQPIDADHGSDHATATVVDVPSAALNPTSIPRAVRATR